MTDTENPMEITKPKVSAFDRHQTNPFSLAVLDEVVLKERYRTLGKLPDGTRVATAISPDGEEVGHLRFVKKQIVDDDKFMKFYLSRLPDFWDIPKNAYKVLCYIAKSILPNQDFVHFNLAECMAYTKYDTKKPIYAGLGKLIEFNVIARGYNESVYFINPLIIFNGNRVDYIESIIKRSAHEKELNG